VSVQSYRERPPAAALAGLISTTWVQHVPRDSAPYVHRNIPNGSVELLCRAGSVPRIVGPLTAPWNELLEPGAAVVGVRFRPGAAASVLGLPVSELTGLVVDADAVWGESAVRAGERIAESADGSSALQALVFGRLIQADGADRPNPLIAEAVRRLMPWQPKQLGPVWSSLHLSERSFRRHCVSAIGVGPKTLQRMLRFQTFLARAQFALSVGRNPALGGLARLAADTGYADQAHLTRECVRLTGVTPRVFLGETERDCGCGHDHAASFTPWLGTATR
jgi:AraC-like DNA-binding protein